MIAPRSIRLLSGDLVTPHLPTGTVALLFTDIEGSTALLHRLGAAYVEAMEQQRTLLRAAVAANGGYEVDTKGDESFFVFPRVSDALAASVAAQRSLATEPAAGDAVVRVRMGVHVGEPVRTREGYVGLAVHCTARLCAAAHGGQVVLSLAAASLVRDDLPPDHSLISLGDHMLRGFVHPEPIFQLSASGLKEQFPPLRTAARHPGNLPTILTSHVGRSTDLLTLNDLVINERLVTLLGPGGMGKTRLALVVAHSMADAFPGGAWWVELERIGDSRLVEQAVADTFGIREEATRAVRAVLIDTLALKARRLLLVLDNCEHLIGACAELVAEVLRNCPNVHILTTTREALRVGAEHVWPLEPLSVPPVGQSSEAADVSQFEAVQLFVQRARKVQPSFILDDVTTPLVAHICRRLDGLPLALELAAARVRVLPVADIASRLDDRFRFLARGDPTLMPRQQTMRAAIDWSYSLLTPSEQELFSRLAVFAGSFSIAAAEAVCVGTTGDGRAAMPPLDALAGISSLADKSLVVTPAPTSELPRYRFLESLHAYGRERLLDSGQAAEMQERHAHYFATSVSSPDPGQPSEPEADWLDRMDADRDNCLAALTWARSHEPALALQLVDGLGSYWFIRGYYTLGREQLDSVLSLPIAQSDPGRIRALDQAGELARLQCDYAAARQMLSNALAAHQSSGDRLSEANTLRRLGKLADEEGLYADAESQYNEALVIYRDHSDSFGIAAVHNNLGLLAHNQGDFAAARQFLEESLTMFREQQVAWAVGATLSNIAILASDEGRFDEAERLSEESNVIANEHGDKAGIAANLTNLGYVRYRRGALPDARATLSDALTLLAELGDTQKIAECLATLAMVLHADQQPEPAVLVLGAAAALRDAVHSPILPKELAEHHALVGALQGQIGTVRYDELFAEGRVVGWQRTLLD